MGRAHTPGVKPERKRQHITGGIEMIYIGGDQQPLLRGILRALAIRFNFPDADIKYLFHDGDTVGREKTGSRRLVSWNGTGWASWVNTFTWTPRIPLPQLNLGEKFHQTLQGGFAKVGLPPQHFQVEGEGASILLRDSTFDAVIAGGFLSELAWFEDLGLDSGRINYLLDVIMTQIDKPLIEAVQGISDAILLHEGEAPIQIASLKGTLKENCALEKFSDKLPPNWRWAPGERNGTILPKGEYLALELALSGRLFCTSIPYWDRVELVASDLGLSVEKPISVRFTQGAPDFVFPKIRKMAMGVKGVKENKDALRTSWMDHWSSKPSLISAFLAGNLRQVFQTAVISNQ